MGKDRCRRPEPGEYRGCLAVYWMRRDWMQYPSKWISSRESILNLLAANGNMAGFSMLVTTAGVITESGFHRTILKSRSVRERLSLLEEVGKVIKENGVGVTISSQSGYRCPHWTIEWVICHQYDPVKNRSRLDMLQPDSIMIRYTPPDGTSVVTKRNGRSCEMGRARARINPFHLVSL